ncbi:MULTISPECIES: phage portal protein [Clostridia]|uniref:phage portal protein n=1 Tax=Clostridia TaxID=186801 RepID=UPI0018F70565|nr:MULTISPECIES: phage portal protein [Clostridia]
MDSSKKRFLDESNKQYVYASTDELLDNLGDLKEMVTNHEKHQASRLKELESYYLGDNTTILKKKRRKEEHLADHRATHNFAKYVSQFIQGYMVGVPIKMQYEDDDKATNEILTSINRINEADAHNSELILDLSIYGRAYELLFRSQDDEVKFVSLNPKGTFVIYDKTVEKKPIAGIRYYREDEGTFIELYTKTQKVKIVHDEEEKLNIVDSEMHFFDGVPIIEYVNNRFRQGDFENVLNLIDLYDAAQSDTANYMTDINDAMLKIVGNLEMDPKEADEMRERNVLLLTPGTDANGKQLNADADYIYKKYDVAGVEKYKDRVQADIHKFTNTPNMNDESFAGVQSGESMKYKLFGLEQVRATKERYFKRSLRTRYRLINNILEFAQEGSFDADKMAITFTPNLPKSAKDEVDMFNSLGGELSEETKLSLLSLVENPQEELERLEKQRKKTRPSQYLDTPN